MPHCPAAGSTESPSQSPVLFVEPESKSDAKSIPLESDSDAESILSPPDPYAELFCCAGVGVVDLMRARAASRLDLEKSSFY